MSRVRGIQGRNTLLGQIVLDTRTIPISIIIIGSDI